MPFLGNVILPDNLISTHVLCSNTVPASYVPIYMERLYVTFIPWWLQHILAKLMLSGDMASTSITKHGTWTHNTMICVIHNIILSKIHIT